MARYDYCCTVCGTRVELVQSIHAPLVPQEWWCATCGQTTRYELAPPRTFVFHLKGEGFYTTDNRDEHERYLFRYFDRSGR